MLRPDNSPPPNRGYQIRDLRHCAEREVGWRRMVYRNRVATHRMSQAQANSEIDKMAAIAELLGELEKKDRLL